VKLWMAPAGLHIEPGCVKDAGQLAKLHAGAFFRGWPAPEFAAFLNDPHSTPAYIACDPKRRTVGFAMLRLADDEAELLTIVVAPKWRGKGVGAALMRATLQDLLMTPVRRMFLEVEDTNKPAIALYNGLGFVEIAQRTGYYQKPEGEPATALVMRCDFD